MACLVCAFATIATRPKAAPWALQGVKGVTLTVVIACVAVAASGNCRSSPELEYPARFVVLVALLCCLPPLLMTSPAATARSVPLVVGPARCHPPRHQQAFEPSFIQSDGIL